MLQAQIIAARAQIKTQYNEFSRERHLSYTLTEKVTS